MWRFDFFEETGEGVDLFAVHFAGDNGVGDVTFRKMKFGEGIVARIGFILAVVVICSSGARRSMRVCGPRNREIAIAVCGGV